MGNAHQPPFGFHFSQAPQGKSAEAHLVFYLAEDSFHLGGTGPSQALPLFGSQILASLAAIFEQAEADPDFAISLGLGTLGS